MYIPGPLLVSSLWIFFLLLYVTSLQKSPLFFCDISKYSYFFAYVKYLSVYEKKACLGKGRGGEVLIFTEINHLILLLWTEAAVPVRPQRKNPP